MTSGIEEHFSQLEDLRVERNQLHGFVDILILVICAVTSSAEGWEAIERFGKAKLQWLRQFAPFANGVPSHDCIANVISRLSAKGFQACFANWTEAIRQATGGEVIAVDGKTARGSRDRNCGEIQRNHGDPEVAGAFGTDRLPRYHRGHGLSA